VKILNAKPINVTIPTETGKTRDILYVKTLVNNKDTVHLFINHWPSRRGGQEKSESNRLKAACIETLMIDSLLDINPKANIISMGDLNDYSDNMAPRLLAQFLNHTIDSTCNKFGGTYNYRGEWGQLDHLFVSDNLMSCSKSKGIKMTSNKGTIFSPDFLLTLYKGTFTPNRFYAGNKYLGGYSDHLSIFIPIKL
jgi:endonuclease/exonuclease/phosphatase family metal-dependent hydrolase